MLGSVQTKETCPVCGSAFTLQILRDTPGMYCAKGCRTVPHRFFVDGRGFRNSGKSVGKLYRDQSGELLDSYLRAARMLESIRADYDKDKAKFRPDKWSNAGMRSYKVSECAHAWQLAMESSGKKSQGYLNHAEMFYRLHINPVLGEMNVREVTPSDIESLQTSLKEKLGEVTVKNVLSVMMTMFIRLRDRGLKIDGYDVFIDRIPAFPEDWSKVEPKKKNWIDEDTQRELLGRMDGWLKLWAKIFYETGMRMGEVCALHRSDVLPDRTVYVQRAIDFVTGGEKPTKTMDTRTVPISEELYQEIAALPIVGDAYLFLSKKGKPYTSGAISTMLRDIYDAAGMPNLRPNCSGRHSMATKRNKEAQESGLVAASAQLGNTPSMAGRAYIQDDSTRIRIPSVVEMREG